MKDRLHTLWRYWDRFWFTPRDPFVLDILRIGLGLGLLITYGVWTPQIRLFFGGEGFFGDTAQAARDNPWWFQSLLFYLKGDAWLQALHALLLIACVCLTLGFQANLAKFVVWAMHLSYLHANPMPFYGADNIAGNILFLFLFAPLGRRISVEAWWRARQGQPPTAPSARCGAILRLIQVQLAIMYFFAGFEKLRGDLWWSGDAVWVALNNVEFMRTPESVRDWLARHYVLINALSYGTVVLECAYPFLIWKRSWRPWILGSVVLMHLGVAAMMGLWYFSGLMIVLNLAFLERPASGSNAKERRLPESPEPVRMLA